MPNDQLDLLGLAKEQLLRKLSPEGQAEETARQQMLQEDQLTKLKALAAKEKESNRSREMANIGASMAREMIGKTDSSPLAIDDTAQKNFLNAVAKLQSASAGREKDPLRDILSVGSLEQRKAEETGRNKRGQDNLSEREKNRELRTEKFKWGKEEANEKQLSDELDNFRNDAVVKIADQQIFAGKVAEAMLNNPNPIMDEAVKTQLARAVGEKGALSESDIQRLGQPKEIVNRLEQIWETYIASGQLTDENRGYLMDIARVLGETGSANKDARAREFAGQRGFGKYEAGQLYDRYMAAPYTPPDAKGLLEKVSIKPEKQAAPVVQAPKSEADLDSMSDEELEAYINEGK